ncbi:phosphatidylethanolamine-binding protein 4-like [Crassostrea angulata]|uniref:phosphatidylethanolamine-binding protein 4-like n=1 Tax=Magallana angulata TaxID=2784310 RepID=UPI0022B167BD|nr:phosphatidylethanolamine-binding protein 4-like [Crassostrea angulata]
MAVEGRKSIRPEQGNKKSSGQKDPKKPATKTKSSLTNQDKTVMSTSVFIVCIFLMFWEGLKACQLPQDNCPPGATLTLASPGGGAVYSKCGDTIDKSAAKEAPQVKFQNVQPDSLYTLVMADPDAPFKDNPTQKYWLHWMVTNIKGSNLMDGNALGGDVVMAYIPPTPPKPEPGTTNPHRYMFYLLEQTDEPDTSLVNQEWRGKFRLDDFVINNGCQIVASFQYTTSF